MKKIIFAIAALSISGTIAATEPTDTLEMIVGPDTAIVVPVEFDADLDEIVHNWYLTNAQLGDCRKDTGLVLGNKELYIERLQKLPYVMEMPYNDIVKKFIEMYLQKSDKVEYMLGLGQTYYFPMFEEALERYGVPLELKYLPVIESALNARATSRAGAAGLWQFMVPTGRLYGLEVNSLVDERRDPLKASDAAARYLRDLYNIYQDWHLVIAAYNCGPGNVAKATRYAGGGKKDYWQIYPYLPSETRSYVPIFIAANYVMNYYREHNMCPMQPTVTVATDTIMVDKRINLQQVSELLNISLDELRFLNPQYRQDIVPGNIKPYPLVLPFNQLSAYIDNRDTIPLHRAAELVANRAEVQPAQYNPSSDGRVTYYKVRSGDTLGGIAARYHCTVNQIKRWNGLRGSMIRIGQRLKIYR
ncbi:MAG: transglycosylase SLT domain-containing protein [Bacteroidales bacterium]|nr:transglycosylase SLT domain-containing protein [Bacteroidales bacterium]MDD6781462.1 transglycosylase SLT domain-containing protein [Bacteroidales bacterium]